MTEYKVDNGRILHEGNIYVEGDVIDLDNSIAARLGQYISSVDKTAPKDKEQSNGDERKVTVVDYEEYTIAELKKLVDKENIDVKPTGKKGSAVKSDYIRALTQSK